MISYLNSDCSVTFSKNEKTLFFLDTSGTKTFVKQEALSKNNTEIISEITLSSDEKESKTVLDSGFHTADSRFQVLDSSLCRWNLDSWFQYLLKFRILWAVFRIPKPRIPDSSSTIFSGLESGFPYMMRTLFVAKDISPHDTFSHMNFPQIRSRACFLNHYLSCDGEKFILLLLFF